MFCSVQSHYFWLNYISINLYFSLSLSITLPTYHHTTLLFVLIFQSTYHASYINFFDVQNNCFLSQLKQLRVNKTDNKNQKIFEQNSNMYKIAIVFYMPCTTAHYTLQLYQLKCKSNLRNFTQYEIWIVHISQCSCRTIDVREYIGAWAAHSVN